MYKFKGDLSFFEFDNDKFKIIKIENHIMISAYDLFSYIGLKYTKKKILNFPKTYRIEKKSIQFDKSVENDDKDEIFLNEKGLNMLYKKYKQNDRCFKLLWFINKSFDLLDKNDLNELFYI